MSAGGGCPGFLGPVCDLVGGAASGIAKDVLHAIVTWIVQSASWVLREIGTVIASTTTIKLGATWFVGHYEVMAALAGIVALPMLLLASIQAVYRQSPAVLARAAFVQLPLAGLLTAVAVKLVALSLTVVDDLSRAVATGAGANITTLLRHAAKWYVAQGMGTTPTFVVALSALVVMAGALALWLELIVRSAAVYVAVLFLPLALASLVWPAVSHWSRRLVEALAAIVLSKFVVVAVLSLALNAAADAPGLSTVLAAGAMLLLSAFAPFMLFRLLPMMEVGAALQLESARHRLTHLATSGPQSAASFALRHAKEMAPGITPGVPGTGTSIDPGRPGEDGPAAGGAAHGGLGGGTGGGDATAGLLPLGPMRPEWVPTRRIPPGPIPVAKGDPEATRQLLESLAHRRVVPTGVGDIIPGVQRPIWGGTEPRNRFVPGPKDSWTMADYLREPGWTDHDVSGGGAAGGTGGAATGGDEGTSDPGGRSILWWPDEPTGSGAGDGDGDGGGR